MIITKKIASENFKKFLKTRVAPFLIEVLKDSIKETVKIQVQEQLGKKD